MLTSNVDVIPNEYEGGFKIWEGLFDLINYLQKSNVLLTDIIQPKYQSSSDEQKIKEITVCDLGCGSGLLSIYIAQQLRNYDCNVRFKIYLQDYNDDVIKLLTIPNVLINELEDSFMINESCSPCQSNEEFIKLLKNKIFKHYCFMYGDWKEIKQVFVKEQIKFDLIITSETIYQEENYSKLYEIFNECLYRPNGTVLIASKSHYFGIGGGTYSFLDFLDERAQQQQEQQSVKRNKTEVDNQITIGSDKSEHHLEGIIVDEIQGNLLRHIVQLKWFNNKNIENCNQIE